MNPYTIPGIQRKPTAHSILEFLSSYYGVNIHQITGSDMSNDLPKIRREAMWMMKTMLNLSLSEIGAVFSKNKSSVLRALQKQAGFIKVYPQVAEQMVNMIKEIK